MAFHPCCGLGRFGKPARKIFACESFKRQNQARPAKTEEKKMKCTRCRWHKNKQNINCTGFFGNQDAEIVFCGEAFGREEAESGTAFVGRAGEKLDELLAIAGIRRDEIAIMNAIRCYQEGNPTPTKREMDACFIYTYRDIQKINPKLCVALGGAALYQLVGKEVVERYIGKVLWSDKINRKVLVLYHPASLFYGTKEERARKWNILVESFSNISNIIEKEVFEPKHYNYEYIKSADRFREVYKSLTSTNVYIDLEGTGLNPYKNNIVILQIGNGKDIFVLDGGILQDVKKELEEIFDSSKVIGQAFIYDVKMLTEHLGIFPKHWYHDTCLAEYIISGLKDNDLTFLTGKYVPESVGYDDEVKKLGGAHNVRNKNLLLQYGADDVGVLPKIERKQRRLLIKNKTDWLFDHIWMPCNKVLTKMSIRGVKYDIDRIKTVDEKYKKKANRALMKIVKLPEVKATEKHFNQRFNPRSHVMVRHLIINEFGLPVLKRSYKTHEPTVGKEEMKKYAEKFKNPYCIAMEKYRSIQLIRDNFLSGVLPKLVDGIAHTTYSQHATASGRPASRDPNLLNIPNDKEVKSCIVARPGYVFLYSDQSQIEVKVAAVVYNDDNLIDVVNSGKDFHSMITARVEKVPYEHIFDELAGEVKEEWKEKRRIAKAVTFGILYGQGAEGLAYRLGIEIDEAQRFIDNYFNSFPQLRDNIEKLKHFIVENGYCDTCFGFRRRWKKHTWDDHNVLREGVNHLVQGSAYHLLQLCLIEIDKLLESYKSSLVMQVYDSIVVELEENEFHLVPKIKHIMENINKPFDGLNRIKLKADVEIGYDLGHLSKFDGVDNVL